jgi:hypothetical protein
MKATNTNAPTAARAFPMSVLKQAIAVCWTNELNLVPVIWGPAGWTKSATINSLCDDLSRHMFDFRLSDKEASDLGGIPCPTDKEFQGAVHKVLEYLANARLPWAELYGDDYPCVLFLDEIDRSNIAVLNVALQLLLDRGVNGRFLSKSCRVVAAGNGSSDTGTTSLTTAANARLVHFYVDTKGPEALTHWIDWAGREGIDPALVGFARFRPEVFSGPTHDYTEVQRPNPRVFTWAAKAVSLLDSLSFGPDVTEAIVFGLIGQAAGLEYLAYRTTLLDCPTFDQVVRDPDTAKLPPEEQVGVLYALGESFLSRLYDPNITEGSKDRKGNVLSPEVNPEHTRLVAKYLRRCATVNPACRESVGWWFRIAGQKLPSLCGLDDYRWVANR